MHSTIHAVCGQQKGQNRVVLIFFFFFFFFLVRRAGRHFGFSKRAGRHEKGAGRRALQKKPRQNTGHAVGYDARIYEQQRSGEIV